MKASLQLRLGQQLAMTPQLRQAIRLLQLSALELQTEVQQALSSNVMLLPDDGSTESTDNPGDHSTDIATDSAAADAPDSRAENERDSYSSADTDDWGKAANQSDPWSDSDWNMIDGIADDAGGETLRDHLLWQLQLSDLDGKRRIVAEVIIDALDDSGYLRESLDSIAATAGVSTTLAESVLHRVQAMDPPGVAARDLGECLQAQLRLLPNDDTTQLARRLVDEYLENIARNSSDSLARQLNTTPEAINAALELIQSLDPSPGDSVDNTRPDYLVPDVLLVQRENRWTVELNSTVIPRLRLNDEYVRLLREASERSDDMQAQLQEARWLIRSLSIRNDTLLRVSEAVVDRQQAYFEKGEEAMRPLLLRDIAETVDLHESTVSRVTANKYLHTPRGTLPLKYFFSQELANSRNNGPADGTSTVAVRAMIRKLVEQENPMRPLSDRQIADTLDDRGIRVARRTVTKYREAMRIPASYARKSLATRRSMT
jgi:RNA polymerase sigma-54 factor